MEKNIKKNLIMILVSIFTLFLFQNSFSFAAEETPQFIPPPTPKITISDKLVFKPIEKCPDDPNKYCVWWLGQYIQAIYNVGVGIVGILAAVGLMVAGFIWLTAGGNASKVSEAKTWLASSFTGLFLVMGSWVILYYINPELVKMKPLRVREVTAMQGNSASRYHCSTSPSCGPNQYESSDPYQCTDNNSTQGDPSNPSNYSGKCCCSVDPLPGCYWASYYDPNCYYYTSSSPDNCGTMYRQDGQGVCCCPGGGISNGSCKSTDSGLCDQKNFEPIWGNLAQTASAICNAESSGRCTCMNLTNSCGPMQIHIPNSPGLFVNYNGTQTDCRSAYGNHRQITHPKFGKIRVSDIINPQLHEQCKQLTCDPKFFVSYTYNEKFKKGGWSHWQATHSGFPCYNLTHN
jgi:hypothetical protein